MNCQTAIELLPWLGNGTLGEEERAAVVAHLASCERCQRELAETQAAAAIHLVHPQPEELYHYAALRPMDAKVRSLVEAHLALCSSCKEELALISESQEQLERPAEPRPAAELPSHTSVRWGPWLRRHTGQLALAAGLAFAVIAPLTLWNASRTAGPAPQLALLTYDLPAASRGTAEGGEVARIPSGQGEEFDVRLVGKVLAGEGRAQVRLISQAGEVLRKEVAVDPASSSVTVRLERRDLPAGVFRLEVWSLEGELLSGLDVTAE